MEEGIWVRCDLCGGLTWIVRRRYPTVLCLQCGRLRPLEAAKKIRRCQVCGSVTPLTLPYFCSLNCAVYHEFLAVLLRPHRRLDVGRLAPNPSLCCHYCGRSFVRRPTRQYLARLLPLGDTAPLRLLIKKIRQRQIPFYYKTHKKCYQIVTGTIKKNLQNFLRNERRRSSLEVVLEYAEQLVYRYKKVLQPLWLDWIEEIEKWEKSEKEGVKRWLEEHLWQMVRLGFAPQSALMFKMGSERVKSAWLKEEAHRWVNRCLTL